jgi:hypothetical protein
VPEPTKAHELLSELEQRGIYPSEVFAAVAMGPAEVLRAAVEVLLKNRRKAPDVIAKYANAKAALALRTHTSLKQLPIIRLVKRLRDHGFSERKAFQTTAEFLEAAYPERFGGLTADHVRLRFKHLGKKR